jgi:hypothetical protein
VVALRLRRKFACNLGMVICFTSFMNLPVETILTIILMTGLAKQRQWLDRSDSNPLPYSTTRRYFAAIKNRPDHY